MLQTPTELHCHDVITAFHLNLDSMLLSFSLLPSGAPFLTTCECDRYVHVYLHALVPLDSAAQPSCFRCFHPKLKVRASANSVILSALILSSHACKLWPIHASFVIPVWPLKLWSWRTFRLREMAQRGHKASVHAACASVQYFTSCMAQKKTLQTVDSGL